MILSDKDIASFITIWREEFGETLTPEEARFEAMQFLDLCRALAEPLPGEPGYEKTHAPQ